MIVVDGKEVLTELPEVVAPGYTAPLGRRSPRYVRPRAPSASWSCTTEGCVESTARDAMFNDYYVVLAEDCVASDDPAQHDAAMLLMRHRFDLATAEQITGAWAFGRRPRDVTGREEVVLG